MPGWLTVIVEVPLPDVMPVPDHVYETGLAVVVATILAVDVLHVILLDDVVVTVIADVFCEIATVETVEVHPEVAVTTKL